MLGRRHHHPVHVLVVEDPPHVGDTLWPDAADRFHHLSNVQAALVVHIADVLEFRILDSGEITAQG